MATLQEPICVAEGPSVPTPWAYHVMSIGVGLINTGE
jgi:hypothetical protein